ncbi:ELKS/Rab6-interacting/CAST family member 1-like [Aphis craccivora]|uniref:ELKS/Rab6-interacting/CAST family member 1-like n=1 Tax=Aphis craccivora TaxID=307492 RepID=A0A6G0WMZ2_APHCR|nr:ELKS/Rab6-interacting/CAST family member 1-like [Aphis craccivora]
MREKQLNEEIDKINNSRTPRLSLAQFTDHLSKSNANVVKKGSDLYKDVIPQTQLVYYDDPNELVTRLTLLISSQNVGNTGVNNKIVSILEELRERNIIIHLPSSWNWINSIFKLVNYNNTKHSTIKCSPHEAQINLCTLKRLQDPVLKTANQIASRKNMLKRLQDPNFKKANQVACRKNMFKRLQDPDVKKANQIASRKNMLKRLQDLDVKNANQIASRKSILKRLQRLQDPEVSSDNKCNSDIFNRLGMSILSDAKSTVTICSSCLQHIKKSKVPPLYIGNGYELNSVPSSVTQLNQIEKQMFSLRLPFMKIFKCLRSDGQLKMKGNIINVPIDLTKTTSILPRRAENLAAVKMMKTIINAEIDKDWLAHVSETTNSLENSSDHESEETDDEDTNIEPINPGSIDTMIENCDFVSFAPGEGMKPLSILIDDHAEEKAFPDLFGGHPRTNKSPLKNYSKYIGKSQRRISKLMRDIVENLKFSTDLSVKE